MTVVRAVLRLSLEAGAYLETCIHHLRKLKWTLEVGGHLVFLFGGLHNFLGRCVTSAYPGGMVAVDFLARSSFVGFASFSFVYILNPDFEF